MAGKEAAECRMAAEAEWWCQCHCAAMGRRLSQVSQTLWPCCLLGWASPATAPRPIVNPPPSWFLLSLPVRPSPRSLVDFDPCRRRWRRRVRPAKSTPLRRAPGRARGRSLSRPERHSVLPLLLASVGKEPSPASPGRLLV
jgi:hypothetical protein